MLDGAAGGAPAAAGAALASAPGLAAPMADVVFMLETPRAVLTADKLALEQAGPLVTSYSSGNQAGVYTIGE